MSTRVFAAEARIASVRLRSDATPQQLRHKDAVNIRGTFHADPNRLFRGVQPGTPAPRVRKENLYVATLAKDPLCPAIRFKHQGDRRDGPTARRGDWSNGHVLSRRTDADRSYRAAADGRAVVDGRRRRTQT